jgi:hypothetical protein
MGIKFLCPNGHKLHVKAFLSGKKAICPKCGVRVVVPADGQQVDDAQLDADSASSAAEAADSQATAESATRSAGNSPAAGASSPAAMTDPIDDAPTAVWYVRPATGGQFGPASGEIMRAWIAEGRVGASSLVWRAGWQEWRAASAIFPQLSSLLASPGVSVGPPKPVAASTAGLLPNSQAGSAAAGLPMGQVVQSVAAHVGAGPHEPVAVPALSPGLRKKRHNRDVSLYASAILLVVSVILVVILIIVWRRQQGPAETETPDNEAGTDISPGLSSLGRIA